jgi:uncharacterized protein (TIGR02444 family)
MSDLWTFALRLYDRSAVKDACLALQKGTGADVCLVLLSCWSNAENFGRWPEPLCRELSSISDEFQQKLLTPLRQTRDHLKMQAPAAATANWAQDMRAEILQAELKIERELLRQYEAAVLRYCGTETARIDAQTPPQVLICDNFLASSSEVQKKFDEEAMAQLQLVISAASDVPKS